MKKFAKKLASGTLATTLLFSSFTAASAATYKVKAGDSLSKIASAHGTTYQAIMKENNLTSTTIKIGQILHINEKNNLSSAVTTVKDQTSIINIAKTYIGTPYLYGGSTKLGFDCSGLVWHVLKQSGKNINRLSAAGFYNQSKKVSSPKAGDLVFFSGTYKKGISHIGIYIGNGKMISATNSGVKVDSVKTGYWGKYFTSYGRI